MQTNDENSEKSVSETSTNECSTGFYVKVATLFRVVSQVYVSFRSLGVQLMDTLHPCNVYNGNG